MIDDDSGVGVKPVGDDAILYDWFKYLMSLALIAIGGVLTLVQGAGQGQIKRAQLIVVLAALVLSGIAAFSGAAQVVSERTGGQPAKYPASKMISVAAISLMIGLGAFVYMFIGVLT